MKKLLKILISHIDLDGYGSNILFRQVGFDDIMEFNFDNGESIENGIDEVFDAILRFNNENFAEHGGAETEIFIVDICPSKEKLEMLAQIVSVKAIHIFDHHMTNITKTEGVNKVTATIVTKHDDGSVASGTSLFYEAMQERYHPFCTDFSHYISTLVKYIKCYDTYEWKNMGNEGLLCKELNVFFNMFENKNDFVDFMLNKPHLTHVSQFKEFQHVFDEAIQLIVKQKLMTEQALIDEILNDPDSVYHGTLMEYHNDGPGEKYNVVYYIQDKRFETISELAFQYLTKYEDVDVFIGIDLKTKVFGFRTIKEHINTAELFAKPIGGGGHPKASGAPLFRRYVSDAIARFIIDSLSDAFNSIDFN